MSGFREVFGDLFALDGDLMCITTNGLVVRGRAVMGGGCALQARQAFPGIERHLGTLLAARGNHVILLGSHGLPANDIRDGTRVIDVCSFPTKDHYINDSTLELVIRSAGELMDLIDNTGHKQVLLPRPGCGLGGLSWDIVRPALDAILDERVTVVGYHEEAT